MPKKQNTEPMTHPGSELPTQRCTEPPFGGMFSDKFKLPRWKPIPGTALYWNIPNEKFFALWRSHPDYVTVLGFQLRKIDMDFDGEWVTVFNPEDLARYVDFYLSAKE